MSYRPDRVCRQVGPCQGALFQSQSMVSGSLFDYCLGGFVVDIVSLSGPRERGYLLLDFVPLWRSVLRGFRSYYESILGGVIVPWILPQDWTMRVFAHVKGEHERSWGGWGGLPFLLS